MGLDLYIEAKITEKATGRCITVPAGGAESEDDLYFVVHWMCGHDKYALRNSWIDILNRHQHTAYNYDAHRIPVPQTALREMCSCLHSYRCTPEANRFTYGDIGCGFWDIGTREQETGRTYRIPGEQTYDTVWNLREHETDFRFKANALYALIGLLDRIHYENRYLPLSAFEGDGIGAGPVILPDDYITAPEDRFAFRENPQAYEWTFRLHNSY